MTPLTFLIMATIMNVALVWLIYSKGNDHEHRR